MAKISDFKLSTQERRNRTFSENFKISKIRELEIGLISIKDLVKSYQITYTTVYRWKEKYGLMKDKKERLIVENESDTHQLIELRKRVAELERIVGQKQILLDFKDKMIDIAEEMYGVDIKKKLSTQVSNISGSDNKKTTSV